MFKSISNNVNDSVDGKKVLAVMSAIAGAVMLAAFLTRKNNSAGPSGPLNHHGKLTRELCKATGLRPGQLRQLKGMADSLARQGRPVDSPLTLLLCPSLMKQARDRKS